MQRGKHLCNVHIHIVGPSPIHLPLNLSSNQDSSSGVIGGMVKGPCTLKFSKGGLQMFLDFEAL